MADVLLKDKNGVEQTYSGVETVELKTADGRVSFSEVLTNPIKWKYYASNAIQTANKTSENKEVTVNLFDDITVLRVWANFTSNIVRFNDSYPYGSYNYEISDNYNITDNVLTLTVDGDATLDYEAKNFVGVLVLYEFNNSSCTINEDGTYDVELSTTDMRNGWRSGITRLGGLTLPFFYQPMPIKNCIIKNVGNNGKLPYYFLNYLDTLETVTLPQTLKAIDTEFAKDCSKLKTIDFTSCNEVVELTDKSFINTNDTLTIKVPISLANEWKEATNWTNFADKIVGV